LVPGNPGDVAANRRVSTVESKSKRWLLAASQAAIVCYIRFRRIVSLTTAGRLTPALIELLEDEPIEHDPANYTYASSSKLDVVT